MHPSLGGLRLGAVPANPQAILESRSASERTRALLVIALCIVAGGGAFFLLRSVNREAELAAMKVDLVSRVSHELKTPLALIKMYAETLALGRTKDQEQLERFAGIITREADRLTAMIQRILDFSRQQAGSMAFRKETVDLAPLVEWVTQQYRPHVEAGGGELVTRIDGDALVHVDRVAAESALLNLLENAHKYTPRDGNERCIEVEMRAVDGVATIDVLDRGIGVPERERELIFSSFYRASNAGEVRGAGLGLGLVRHFADAHGGSVRAMGREGGGSVFRLTLPALPAEGSADEERP
jgi:signal transduction histidine kinase